MAQPRTAQATAAKRDAYLKSISHVDITELRRLYLDENWTYSAIKQRYNLTGSALDKIIKENNLHKSRKAAAVHVLATKYAKAGGKQQYEQNRQAVMAANLEAHGISQQQYRQQKSDACKRAWQARRAPEVAAARLQKTKEVYLDCPDRLKAAAEKRAETNLLRYGVANTYQLAEYTSSSNINAAFAERLAQAGLAYQAEFRVGNFRFDFKVADTLIEVNPWPFHNVLWSPVGQPKDVMYHCNKSKAAQDAGFRCIHLWDWDDPDQVVRMLQQKHQVYARKCVVKSIDNEQANHFLAQYHLQGACVSPSQVSFGLFEGEELVQVLTLGKPRYARDCQWELLRLATKPAVHVAGGASRLFKCFAAQHQPQSVVSYCDCSKFDGRVYRALGFQLKRINRPSGHWYRPAGHKHFTDNLVRQHGVDRLLGQHYGKGTDNAALLIQHGFVHIYDCGQARWEWRS